MNAGTIDRIHQYVGDAFRHMATGSDKVQTASQDAKFPNWKVRSVAADKVTGMGTDVSNADYIEIIAAIGRLKKVTEPQTAETWLSILVGELRAIASIEVPGFHRTSRAPDAQSRDKSSTGPRTRSDV
jgi:hypothetical protein